jgi:hypothetical protein
MVDLGTLDGTDSSATAVNANGQVAGNVTAGNATPSQGPSRTCRPAGFSGPAGRDWSGGANGGTGAAGPVGPPGAQGPQGPSGPGLVSGSFLLLGKGVPPPPGYTLVGSVRMHFDDEADHNNDHRHDDSDKRRINLYLKN